MADKGYVVITIRKEVPTREAARTIYDMVKQKLEDHPEVQINGLFSNHFDLDQE